jgi:hypothetical protein
MPLLSKNHCIKPIGQNRTKLQGSLRTSLSLPKIHTTVMSSSSPKKKAAKTSGRQPSFLRDDRLRMGGARDAEPADNNMPPPPAVVRVHQPAAAPACGTSETISLLSDESPLVIEIGDDEDSPIIFTSELRIRVKSKLNRNVTESNPDTHPIGFFRNIMQQLVNKRGILIQKAKKVEDATNFCGTSRPWRDLAHGLSVAIPKSVRQQIGKGECVTNFLQIWEILYRVIYHQEGILGRRLGPDIDDYVSLMERTVSNAFAEMEEERTSDVNCKSMKMPRGEDTRGYLADGSKKPSKEFQDCPKCGFPFVHEHVDNPAKAKRNANKDAAYLAKSKVLENFKKGIVKEPPKDSKGKFLYKIIVEKQDDLLLICKANTRKHSGVAGGYTCPNCTNRSCKLCKNHCRFVCSKK